MNTTLLIQQLTVAIMVSAVAVVAIQKIKVWFPAKLVEVLSGLVSVILGVLMARYYAGYDWIACAWVGFYALIGAEAIYKLLAEKLETYTEKKEIQDQTILTNNEESAQETNGTE